MAKRKVPNKEKAGNNPTVVLETSIPLLTIDGVPFVVFETQQELERSAYATLLRDGEAVLDQIALQWDSELAKQRQEERTGLLEAFRQRNAIVSYMRQAYPERLMRSGDVAEAVVMEMESRWSRKLSSLLSIFGSRLLPATARKREEK